MRDRLPTLHHPLLTAAGVILIFAALRAAWLAQDVILLGFLAILIATLMSFPVRWLSKLIPRGFAAVIALLCVVGAIVGVGLLAAPAISSQARQVVQQAPVAEKRVRDWLQNIERQVPVASGSRGAPAASVVAKNVPQMVGAAVKKAVPAAFEAASGVFAAILILVLATFLVHRPDLYRDATRRLVPRDYESVFDDVWSRLATGLRHWMGGIIISMTIMGTLAATGLALVGMHDWLVLGLLTFLGTFIPYVGAIASAVPGLILGLAQSPQEFFYVTLVYIGVHIVEGYIVQPFIMRRAVELKPALLLFWQALMGAVFGILGIVVATPLLVCTKILVGNLYIGRELGKGQGAEEVRKRSA